MWRTLVHAGVLFPPEYEPHGVKMLYDGVPVDLTPEQEEVATFFAVMKETGAGSSQHSPVLAWMGMSEGGAGPSAQACYCWCCCCHHLCSQSWWRQVRA